ncbi:MAG: hypothetical protein WC924_02775 [Candidatus Gracilibacteria bacterium]
MAEDGEPQVPVDEAPEETTACAVWGPPENAVSNEFLGLEGKTPQGYREAQYEALKRAPLSTVVGRHVQAIMDGIAAGDALRDRVEQIVLALAAQWSASVNEEAPLAVVQTWAARLDYHWSPSAIFANFSVPSACVGLLFVDFLRTKGLKVGDLTPDSDSDRKGNFVFCVQIPLAQADEISARACGKTELPEAVMDDVAGQVGATAIEARL